MRVPSDIVHIFPNTEQMTAAAEEQKLVLVSTVEVNCTCLCKLHIQCLFETLAQPHQKDSKAPLSSSFGLMSNLLVALPYRP